MLGIGRPIFDKSEKIALGTPRHPQGTPRGPKMPSNATWFPQHVPKCRQMRHGFDNMFQNAVKCEMVSTTCSKMPSNATWFRQHVPKCRQMRHGFDNILIKEYGALGRSGPWTRAFFGSWPWPLALDHHDQDDDDYVVTT